MGFANYDYYYSNEPSSLVYSSKARQTLGVSGGLQQTVVLPVPSPVSGSYLSSPTSSTTPLALSSPLNTAKPLPPLRHSPSNSNNSAGNSSQQHHVTQTTSRKRPLSQLSQSYSVVDIDELSDMPLHEPSSNSTSKSSGHHRPRKLEKPRRSGSSHRSTRRAADGDLDQQQTSLVSSVAPQLPLPHALHHAASFPPMAATADGDQTSKTLTRARSNIRQPGDANHLRPPKDRADGNSSGYLPGLGKPGAMGSLGASSSDHSHATVVPHGQLRAALHRQEDDIWAYHKAAGNVPKPFKPFAFQFPSRRSPTNSNGASRHVSDASHTNAAALAAVSSTTQAPAPSAPVRSSADAMGSTHSVHSGYSFELPWEGRESE